MRYLTSSAPSAGLSILSWSGATGRFISRSSMLEAVADAAAEPLTETMGEDAECVEPDAVRGRKPFAGVDALPGIVTVVLGDERLLVGGKGLHARAEA